MHEVNFREVKPEMLLQAEDCLGKVGKTVPNFMSEGPTSKETLTKSSNKKQIPDLSSTRLQLKLNTRFGFTLIKAGKLHRC